MNATFGKLLFILAFIHFVKGYADLEIPNDFVKSYYEVYRELNNSDRETGLIRKLFWEDIEEIMKEHFRYDGTGKKRELSCHIEMNGFEEKRIEEQEWDPFSLVEKGMFTKEQVEEEIWRKERYTRRPSEGNNEDKAEKQESKSFQ